MIKIYSYIGFSFSLFISSSAHAALIDPQNDYYQALSSINSYTPSTCSADTQFYTSEVDGLQQKSDHVTSNPYTMRSPVGRGWAVLYNLGINLARLRGADRLLDSSCLDEAKVFYRVVIRTTSDVTLQNRAMLGLDDIKDRAAKR